MDESAAYALISEQEERYRRTLEDVVRGIPSKVKFVLLAGPSASGKTTSARIFRDIFSQYGKRACLVSLDDFYKEPGHYPLLPDGKPDFETVYALDLDLLKATFSTLKNDGEAYFPAFDFIAKKRIPNIRKIKSSDCNFLIIEGLHALNPEILSSFPEGSTFGIYLDVSCDAGGLSGADIRLIRRLTRDVKRRSSDAEETFELWQRVTAGEKKYLFPYKNHADARVNTFHSYEPNIFAKIARPMLSAAEHGSVYYKQAERLLALLAEFPEIPASLVPETSLLKEFI